MLKIQRACDTVLWLRRDRVHALASRFHGKFADIKGRRLPPTTVMKALAATVVSIIVARVAGDGTASERTAQLMIGRCARIDARLKNGR